MTPDRPYRTARSEAEALIELRRCSGTHFDPRVVDALVAVAARDAGRRGLARPQAFARS
jgi:HD-GYP domain-containing protein (c-di-GMP phosphodiesterase class II)